MFESRIKYYKEYCSIEVTNVMPISSTKFVGVIVGPEDKIIISEGMQSYIILTKQEYIEAMKFLH